MKKFIAVLLSLVIAVSIFPLLPVTAADYQDPALLANLTNVAIGKNYTTTGIRDKQDGNGYYPDSGATKQPDGTMTGGTELTDGVWCTTYDLTGDDEVNDPTSSSYNGKNCRDYFVGFNDGTDSQSCVIIDLEKVYNIEIVRTHIYHYDGHGVGVPTIKVAYGVTNDSFSQLQSSTYGDDTTQNGAYNCDYKSNFKARYIKIIIEHAPNKSWAFLSEIEVFSADVQNVARDKAYTSKGIVSVVNENVSDAYPTVAAYPDGSAVQKDDGTWTDGSELTDGKSFLDDYAYYNDSGYVGFHAATKRSQVVIDLGKVTSVDLVRVWTAAIYGGGIYTPDNINVSYSIDGTTFSANPLATNTDQYVNAEYQNPDTAFRRKTLTTKKLLRTSQSIGYTIDAKNRVFARYVKVELSNNIASGASKPTGWIFLSEIEVLSERTADNTVKATAVQGSADIQTATNYNLRFISELNVNLSEWDFVGFVVYESNSKKTFDVSSSTVYRSLSGTVNGVAVNNAYAAKDGNYLSALAITDIPKGSAYEFIISPYLVIKSTYQRVYSDPFIVKVSQDGTIS